MYIRVHVCCGSASRFLLILGLDLENLVSNGEYQVSENSPSVTQQKGCRNEWSLHGPVAQRAPSPLNSTKCIFTEVCIGVQMSVCVCVRVKLTPSHRQ